MHKNKALLFLLVSLAVSALTIWAAVRWVNRQVDSRVSHQSVKVVVAAAPVQAGDTLNAGLLKTIDWPASEPLVGALSDINQFSNRVVVSPLSIGEPVLESLLAPQGSRAGLTALIPSGKRAMAVHVTDVSGVAGFALPGSVVDVLVSFQDEQNHMISHLILQNVTVLAVAQDINVKEDIKAKVVNVVTLEVTPEQAEKLELAKAMGSISLVLRNSMDKQQVVTSGARKIQLLQGTGTTVPSQPVITRQASPVKRNPDQTIEVIRGTVRGAMTPQ